MKADILGTLMDKVYRCVHRNQLCTQVYVAWLLYKKICFLCRVPLFSNPLYNISHSNLVRGRGEGGMQVPPLRTTIPIDNLPQHSTVLHKQIISYKDSEFHQKKSRAVVVSCCISSYVLGWLCVCTHVYMHINCQVVIDLLLNKVKELLVHTYTSMPVHMYVRSMLKTPSPWGRLSFLPSEVFKERTFHRFMVLNLPPQGIWTHCSFGIYRKNLLTTNCKFAKSID